MRHFERYVEHQGFAVSFWIDTREKRAVQDWHPGWVPEVMGTFSNSLIELYESYRACVIDPIVSLINDLAESITKSLQPFLR